MIGQRAQHVAQIADLKSMLEAVSQDRASLTEINNALRNEARGAEGEVARLQGEIAGLRGNLVRVRNQRADEHIHQLQQQSAAQNNTISRPVSPPSGKTAGTRTTTAAPLQQLKRPNSASSSSLKIQGQKPPNNNTSNSSSSIYGRPVTTVSLANQPTNPAIRSRGGTSVRNYNSMED